MRIFRNEGRIGKKKTRNIGRFAKPKESKIDVRTLINKTNPIDQTCPVCPPIGFSQTSLRMLLSILNLNSALNSNSNDYQNPVKFFQNMTNINSFISPNLIPLSNLWPNQQQLQNQENLFHWWYLQMIEKTKQDRAGFVGHLWNPIIRELFLRANLFWRIYFLFFLPISLIYQHHYIKKN